MQTEPHRFTAQDLVAGDPGLDLVNTVTARDGEPRDWLVDYRALLDWAALTGAFTAADLAALAREARAAPARAQAALRRCKALREALHAVYSGWSRSRAPARADIAVLDRFRAAAHARATLATAGEGLVPTATRARAGLDLVADTIVLATLDLLRAPDPARLRTCAGNDCGWLFRDVSKAGRRRWCDMGVCGASAKQRGARARRAAAEAGE